MESNENNWKAGEAVNFPWTDNTFKKQGSTSYKHYYNSRFVCIREAHDGQRGILLKVLGKLSARDILVVGGEAFCKDERDDSIKGKSYYGFRFPDSRELTEALAALREKPELMKALKESEMYLDPDSTFWVREPKCSLLRKKPQFYDPKTGTVRPATDDEPHCRLTLVFFHKGTLTF